MAVNVYTTPTCTFCTQVKGYLREHNVRFTEYDIARDQRKAEEMMNKSRQAGVPVIDFNGSIIVGFDRDRLDRLIHRTRSR